MNRITRIHSSYSSYSNSHNTQPPRLGTRRRTGKSSHSMFSDQRIRRRFPAGWFFLLFSCIVASISLYTVIDNGILRIEHVNVTIPAMDRAFEGFTILHISDLHGKRFGPEQKQLAELLRNVRYNAVCITGDVTAPDGDPHAFYELLDALDPTKPVFFIAGDEDPSAIVSEPHYTNDVLAEFIVGAQRKGAIYVDTPQRISFGDKSVWMVPEAQLSLDLDAAEKKFREQLRADQMGGNAHLAGIKTRERMLYYQLDVIERTRTARAAMQPADLQIALAHHPLQADFIRELQGVSASVSYARSLDLILVGHYNAGQVRLPFLGPIFVPDKSLPRNGWFPGDANVHGLRQVAGIAQFINAGMGVSGAYNLPVRLFNGPKIALLKMTSSLVP